MFEGSIMHFVAATNYCIVPGSYWFCSGAVSNYIAVFLCPNRLLFGGRCWTLTPTSYELKLVVGKTH